VRFRLERNGLPVQPIVGELVARFDPYDPETQRSADLTDMAFDSTGRLIVVSAQPARLYRFAPDPDRVFDARDGARAPWVNLAEMTGNASMKIENVFVDALDRAYVTSGDAYGHDPGLGGAVWRAIEEGAGRH
jgi:hypothetical protein